MDNPSFKDDVVSYGSGAGNIGVSNGSECSFEQFDTVSKEDAAFSALNAALGAYSASRKGPTIVCSQGMFSSLEMRAKLPAMDQFPLMSIRWGASTNA